MNLLMPPPVHSHDLPPDPQTPPADLPPVAPPAPDLEPPPMQEPPDERPTPVREPSETPSPMARLSGLALVMALADDAARAAQTSSLAFEWRPVRLSPPPYFALHES